MPTTLTVRDETTRGDTLHEFALELLTERITVRELIRSRVYQEVQDYNRLQPQVFHGLVRPTDAENGPNGFQFRKPRTINWTTQYAQAVQAFERSGILILVDEKQVESLDEEMVVRPDTRVSFLRLTMLVGG
jgi:hypothetical protein